MGSFGSVQFQKSGLSEENIADFFSGQIHRLQVVMKSYR